MEIQEIALLLVKAETTYGTDPVPTNALNIVPTVRDTVSWNIQSTPITRKLLDGSFDAVPGFNAMPNVELKFKYELRGNRIDGANNLDITNGTATQKLEMDALLQACNLTPTYVAAVTPGVQGTSPGSRDGFVTYQPFVPVGVGPSVTCYWQTQLKLHKLTGGKVTAVFTFEAGKITEMEFTVRGMYVAIIDNAISLTGAAFLKTKPPIWDTSLITYNNLQTPPIAKVVVDLGNRIELRQDLNSAFNVAGFVIAGFTPKGSFDPEVITEATLPFWSNWQTSLPQPLKVISPGGTIAPTGNQFVMTLNIEAKKHAIAARAGVRNLNLDFDIVKSDLTQAIGSQFLLKFL
jgi:hypothetical protein